MAGFAALWTLVAAISNGTTFHLAPVIVAGVPAISWAGHRLTGLLIGISGPTAVALGLSIAGLLNGPSLLPFGGALFESIVGAALGAVAGTIARSMVNSDSRIEKSESIAVG